MDDTDIQRLADIILASTELAKAPNEARAEFGYNLAMHRGLIEGLTVAGSKDLAERVKRRIEWTLYSNRDKPDSN